MDTASGIGIPVAFGAGLISFLSPCVLPLVPGYISAVAGVAPGQIRAGRVLGPTLAFIASFSAPQGLFWAKLSAASVLAIAPILIFGWISQKQLVSGLTFGAVK